MHKYFIDHLTGAIKKEMHRPDDEGNYYFERNVTSIEWAGPWLSDFPSVLLINKKERGGYDQLSLRELAKNEQISLHYRNNRLILRTVFFLEMTSLLNGPAVPSAYRCLTVSYHSCFLVGKSLDQENGLPIKFNAGKMRHFLFEKNWSIHICV